MPREGSCVRALLLPQVVGGELTAESDFYGYRQIMQMLPKYEPSFCYLWVRGRDEDVPRLWPNVEVFAEATQSQTFYQQMVAVTGRLFEMFNRISGPYPVDAVFTSRAGLVPALMLGLATTAEQPVPVVLLEPRVYAPGSVSHNSVTWMDAAARSLGYAMAFGAYWSEWERDEAFRCIEAWLSPAALQEAQNHAFVLPYVVDVPVNALELRKSTDSIGKAKRLLFCGRLNANKKFDVVLRSYGKVLMSRMDIDVWVHAGTGAFGKLDPATSRWHMTSEKLPLREDYHALLATANVGAYASVDEGVNATVMEMLSWGIVMALPDRPWVRKLFHGVEYPYTFKSEKELPALLDWLLDHEDEARATLDPIRTEIRRRHSEDVWRTGWTKLFDAVKEWNEKYAPDPLRRFREDVKHLLEVQASPLSFATARSSSAIMRSRRPYERRVFSNYAAYLSVKDMDDFETTTPSLSVQPLGEAAV